MWSFGPPNLLGIESFQQALLEDYPRHPQKGGLSFGLWVCISPYVYIYIYSYVYIYIYVYICLFISFTENTSTGGSFALFAGMFLINRICFIEPLKKPHNDDLNWRNS